MPSHVSFSLNSGSAGFSPDFTRIEPVFVVVGSLPGETDPARPTVAGNRSAGYPISSQDVRSVKEKPVCKKITTFPGFDDKAEEAANFYASIFKHSRMGRIARYGEAGAAASGRPKRSVKDIEKSERVMKAMLQIKKIDIQKLKQAWGQG